VGERRLRVLQSPVFAPLTRLADWAAAGSPIGGDARSCALMLAWSVRQGIVCGA